jgi:hypothetical protein
MASSAAPNDPQDSGGPAPFDARGRKWWQALLVCPRQKASMVGADVFIPEKANSSAPPDDLSI